MRAAMARSLLRRPGACRGPCRSDSLKYHLDQPPHLHPRRSGGAHRAIPTPGNKRLSPAHACHPPPQGSLITMARLAAAGAALVLAVFLALPVRPPRRASAPCDERSAAPAGWPLRIHHMESQPC